MSVKIAHKNDDLLGLIRDGHAQPIEIKKYPELSRLSEEFGNSFFLLDTLRFRMNLRALLGAFTHSYPSVKIGYSFKTNYTPRLCQVALEEGAYAEVVSEMEYALAKRLVRDSSHVIFNGPYKAEWAFKDAALSGAIINLDSKRDIELLQAASKLSADKKISVAIRCNFAISETTSRFGFDPGGEDFKAALEIIGALPNVTLKGLHCHFPDRDLQSFERRAEQIVDLSKRIFPDKAPELLNLGGGYFSNMPESLKTQRSEPPATFSDYGSLIGSTLTKAFATAQRKPTLFIEPGTAIVADTQVFYSKVISTKVVRETGFATIAGSIFDVSPNSRTKGLPLTHIPKDQPEKEVGHRIHQIVGYTCIESDVLTTNLNQVIRPGDFVAYSNVGSYSVVMRPPFILPSNPVLIQDGPSAQIEVAKHRQTNESVFNDFVF